MLGLLKLQKLIKIKIATRNSKTPLTKTTITTIKHNQWKPHNYEQIQKANSKKHQFKPEILDNWVELLLYGWFYLSKWCFCSLSFLVGNLIWQVYQSLLGVGTLSQGLFTRFGGEQYLFDLLKYLVWPKYLICSKNLNCLISFFSCFLLEGEGRAFLFTESFFYCWRLFFGVVNRPGENLFGL